MLTPEDREFQHKLKQEILDHEIEERCKQDTEFKRKKEKVEEALDILTSEGIPAMVFVVLDGKDNFFQYNNMAKVIPTDNTSKNRLRIHNLVRKLAVSVVYHFFGYSPYMKEHPLKEGLNYMRYILTFTPEKWKELGEKIVSKNFKDE